MDKVSFIPIKEIIRIEANGNYSNFYFEDGSKKIISKTLKTYEGILPKSLFCRIHQSNIINLDFLKEYSKENGGVAILNDGSKIVIARRRKDEFLKAMTTKNQ